MPFELSTVILELVSEQHILGPPICTLDRHIVLEIQILFEDRFCCLCQPVLVHQHLLEE